MSYMRRTFRHIKPWNYILPFVLILPVNKKCLPKTKKIGVEVRIVLRLEPISQPKQKKDHRFA